MQEVYLSSTSFSHTLYRVLLHVSFSSRVRVSEVSGLIHRFIYICVSVYTCTTKSGNLKTKVINKLSIHRFHTISTRLMLQIKICHALPKVPCTMHFVFVILYDCKPLYLLITLASPSVLLFLGASSYCFTFPFFIHFICGTEDWKSYF